MLKMDLRKINENVLNKFKEDIPVYISENVDEKALYVGGIKGAEFLEPISKNEIINAVINYVDNLFPSILRDIDGRELLVVKVEKRNYNGYNLVDSVTEISIGTYQLGFGTGTIYHTITLSNFDKDTQDKNFKNAISKFSGTEMKYYQEIYDEQTPIYRSFHCVNDMILQSLYEGFKYQYGISKNYNELKNDIEEFIEDSEFSNIKNILVITENKKNNGANILLNEDILELTA